MYFLTMDQACGALRDASLIYHTSALDASCGTSAASLPSQSNTVAMVGLYGDPLVLGTQAAEVSGGLIAVLQQQLGQALGQCRRGKGCGEGAPHTDDPFASHLFHSAAAGSAQLMQSHTWISCGCPTLAHLHALTYLACHGAVCTIGQADLALAMLLGVLQDKQGGEL